jgi:VIT1/CCC1 family predicted Fe2+/Mn2+ transporter
MENPVMQLEEITAAIKNLSVEERRKVALYILDLEKQHIKGTIGPQIAEDLESVSRVIQNAADKIKQHLKDKL